MVTDVDAASNSRVSLIAGGRGRMLTGAILGEPGPGIAVRVEPVRRSAAGRPRTPAVRGGHRVLGRRRRVRRDCPDRGRGSGSHRTAPHRDRGCRRRRGPAGGVAGKQPDLGRRGLRRVVRHRQRVGLLRRRGRGRQGIRPESGSGDGPHRRCVRRRPARGVLGDHRDVLGDRLARCVRHAGRGHLRRITDRRGADAGGGVPCARLRCRGRTRARDCDDRGGVLRGAGRAGSGSDRGPVRDDGFRRELRPCLHRLGIAGLLGPQVGARLGDATHGFTAALRLGAVSAALAFALYVLLTRLRERTMAPGT